jgi:hypothetical protein
MKWRFGKPVPHFRPMYGRFSREEGLGALAMLAFIVYRR